MEENNHHEDDHYNHHVHERGHDHEGHGHSHGIVDASIVRSEEGVKAVSLSFLVLLITALLQGGFYLSGHSVALLSDLIHNFGDALTAIPLGLAFFFKSKKGEHYAGYFVVTLIFISACAALYEVIQRLIHPQTLSHLWIVLAAGIIGVLGNGLAAVIRTRAGKHLNSPALIADGKHAQIDSTVSAGVIVSTILVALGFKQADPLIGLFITLLILRISWQSWLDIRNA